MKKKLITLLIFTLVAASFWYFYQSTYQNEATDQITLYGNIDIREVNLSFNGSEHIRKILVQEGDQVKKDQKLAFLHTELFQAYSAQAKAQVDAQKQVLAALLAGTRPEEINQNRAVLEAAKAKAVGSHDTAERLTTLSKEQSISKDEAERARAIANADAAQVKALQATLDLALAGPRKEDIAQAKAILQAKQASYVLAQEHLKDATLYSPADGIIRNRILEEGDMASPQTAVLSLALTDPVWVRAYLSESQLGKIKPGMSARIHTDSYPDKYYSGWVGYISPSAEFTPKNIETTELRTHLVYQVRIYSCNEDNELRLGMPATTTINHKQKTPENSALIKHCQTSEQ